MRVADVFWEPRRLVFVIQCSEFTPFEVAKRNSDYQKVGYQVVWILDDRLYNKKVLRPGEALARTQPCYYGSIRKTEQPMFYDQFELIQEEIRIYRGWRMRVHFKTPLTLPERDWDADIFPKQVIAKAASNNLYFRGDLIHYSIQSEIIPSYSRAIHNLKSLEIIYDIKDESTLWRKFLHTWILEPLGCLYLGVYDWLEKKNLSS
jgi:competence protein CoiA